MSATPQVMPPAAWWPRCCLIVNGTPRGYTTGMAKNSFLALLRGINVGGNNIIKMDELNTVFCGMGFSNVATYIQSGNVLFDAGGSSTASLQKKIEAVMTERLGTGIRTAVLSADDLRAVVEKKPAGFGEEKDVYRYDVIFMIPPSPWTAAEAAPLVRQREGVDTLYAGAGVLYIRRLTSALSKSYFSKVASSPVYPHITVRNWNTTGKLYGLMGAR